MNQFALKLWIGFCFLIQLNCGTYLLLQQELFSDQKDPNWLLAALGLSSSTPAFQFSAASLGLTSTNSSNPSTGSYSISVRNIPTKWDTDQFSFTVLITATACQGYLFFDGSTPPPFESSALSKSNGYSYTANLTGLGDPSQIINCTLAHTISKPSLGYLTTGASIGDIPLSIPIML